ncbi:Cellulose synthase-like protein E6 [Vitis vinifera]|uniref:Cellulose synthase-like protein E6 n=1 Tax=Vitis vinifera TaxID=29760 RepID=A0A438DDX6_VITVI|nr:Cellulose synthase-like protein E6 [Vitis vinifera]
MLSLRNHLPTSRHVGEIWNENYIKAIAYRAEVVNVWKMGRDGQLPLFETKAAKGRLLFGLYAVSTFVGICLICVYRLTHLPEEGEVGRWPWIGLFLSELWYILYWFVILSVRWSPIYRNTFKDRLTQRYEKVLPGIDIFVCTANPIIEPPTMVINTVLSVMAYDYQPEKLSIYLSDDGGSCLTFYALLEASQFSKIWLPFCKKFKVEPRCPEAYFSSTPKPHHDDPLMAEEWSSIKKLYEDMRNRIEAVMNMGQITEEIRKQHKGFGEWNLASEPQNHQTILQILIDGRDGKAVDVEGQPLPTLVYLSREKRSKYHHNFKAGAMNTLIRVSSRISNGEIILNVDCDMYSNNSESVRDALCFFMDEESGHEIAYVQFPQCFNNITKNDLYANSLNVELAGFDSNGGPSYIGTGCFHRRETLCGKKYSEECEREQTTRNNNERIEENASVLEETCKVLASCSYEDYTQWGKEMGLKYGCPVEDTLTGLSIQCRGWKSIYFTPERKAFLGVAPTTLLQSLIQHKRWAEGDFQIFLSSYCPFTYGHKMIPLKLQISYCLFVLLAPNCLPTLYYVAIPSLCLLKGISLFPKISSLWILPFAHVISSSCAYSLETILKLLGFAKSSFAVTSKVADEEESKRFEKEVMEFGAPSPIFTILATLALLNLFAFIGGIKRMIMDVPAHVLDSLLLQVLLCGVLVFINLPVYQGLFLQKDASRVPYSVTYQSIAFTLLACSIALY